MPFACAAVECIKLPGVIMVMDIVTIRAVQLVSKSTWLAQRAWYAWKPTTTASKIVSSAPLFTWCGLMN